MLKQRLESHRRGDENVNLGEIVPRRRLGEKTRLEPAHASRKNAENARRLPGELLGRREQEGARTALLVRLELHDDWQQKRQRLAAPRGRDGEQLIPGAQNRHRLTLDRRRLFEIRLSHALEQPRAALEALVQLFETL